MTSTYASVTCPHCGSTDTSWKTKASLWECQSCEARFPGNPPEAAHRVLSERAARPKKIFFSYGHDSNRELVECFRVDLKKRGHKVWIDWKEIGNWDDWKGSITRGIDTSELTIAFITHHAMRNPGGVCRNEIAIAMNRFGVVDLVLLEAGAKDAIPVIAKDGHWADLSTWRDVRDGKIPGVEWERWYEEKLVNLIERLEGEATTFADETHTLRRALRPSSFESKIAQHVPGFIGRDWVFDAYRQWLDDAGSRLFWIKAGPGVGKSAIAANLASRERSAIVASWFIDAKSNELRNPGHALRSLAFQLAQRWEDYRVRLMRQLQLGANATEENCDEVWRALGTRNTQDLFRFLLAEPLNGLIWREHKLVIVIDALDEGSDGDGHNRIAELIGLELNSLPDWIGFVVTSRPEADVVNRLQGFKPFVLDASDPRNRADLVEWCRAHLSTNPTLAALPPAQQAETENLLVERSEGMILYLKVVEEGLREGSLTVAQLGQLEAGLPGLYRRYYDSFVLRFGQDYETAAKPLLRLLLAAAGALPEDLASAALQWNKEQFLACRNRLGSFVTDTPDGQELFHKTLREWLDSPASGPFFLDAGIGRQAIADVLFAEVGRSEAYALRWRDMIRSWLPQWLPHLDQRSDAAELNKLAFALNAFGDFTEAEPLHREALDVRRAALPAGHPDIATCLNNLAYLLNATGRFAEAEPLYREALNIVRAALPAGHPDIATCLNNLAYLLNATGRFAEAEPLYREALEIRRAALPAGHPHIANSLDNLANLLQSTTRQTEAEPLYHEALDIFRAALPAGHPHIAISLHNLALLLESTGRTTEAEPLFREALDMNRAALPAGHPEIATCLHHLASLLNAAARYAEAEPLFREALDIWRAALPAGHPNIAMSLHNLALLLESTGRTAEAEPLFREALDIWRAALPAGHPNIAMSLHNLALLLESTGRTAEAEPLFREALEIRRATLPAGHPDIANSLNNLALLQHSTGRFSEAEPLFREALDILRAALPAGHPDIAISLNLLAVLQHSTGRFSEAEPLYRELLEMHRAALPAGHPDIATGLNHLAELLNATGRFSEAEPLFRELLEMHRAALPAGHPDIATGLNHLAELLNATGRFSEAEPLFREALEMRRAALPVGHPDIATGLNHLAELLNATGRFSEAEPLFREALEMRRAALPVGHPDIATSLSRLAVLLQWTDRAAEAVPIHRESIMILETADTDGATSSRALEARRCLAVSLRDSNEFDESFQEFRRLLDAEYQNIGREHELTLKTEFGFAKLLRMKGDLDEARKVLDDALPRARKVLGDGHSITKDLFELQNTLSESRTS